MTKSYKSISLMSHNKIYILNFLTLIDTSIEGLKESECVLSEFFFQIWVQFQFFGWGWGNAKCRVNPLRDLVVLDLNNIFLIIFIACFLCQAGVSFTITIVCQWRQIHYATVAFQGLKHEAKLTKSTKNYEFNQILMPWGRT